MAKCDRKTVHLMVLGRLVFPQNGGRKESREKETKIHTQMARDTKKNHQKLPKADGKHSTTTKGREINRRNEGLMGGTGGRTGLPAKLDQKPHSKVVEGFVSPLTTLTGKWTHKVSRREEPEMPKSQNCP
jgi:hypothetical protein